MKISKINRLLLQEYLKIWNKNFKFDSFIGISSLVINLFSIVLVVIIISINSGFKNNINSIMEDISGVTRVYSNDAPFLLIDDFNNISKDGNLKISKVIEKKCIVKYKGNNQSVLLTGLEPSEHRIDNIEKFIYEGSFIDSCVLVGKLLVEKLNLKTDDALTIISLEDKDKKKIKKIKISGIFATNIPQYDKHIIYGDLNYLHDFFYDKDVFYSYFVSNEKEIQINEDMYIAESLFDRNTSFFNWLNTYDNPIKLLIFFIFLISVINMFNNNYFAVYNKRYQIKILKILGTSDYNLNKIFLIRSLTYSLLSSIFGLLIAYIILSIENKFHFITLPKYIYFIDHLPIEFNSTILIVIVLYIFFVTILSSILSYKIQIKHL